jgi:DNA-binding winged helix-turn-helix (wHTH) protein
MDYKQLYNLEDDTLLTLYPSILRMEVKSEFVQNYQLDAISFTIIFLLCATKPAIVTYKELIEILAKIGVSLNNSRDLEYFIHSLQKRLSTYRVKNLIIHIKRKGYGISRDWVDPIEAKKRRRLIQYVKKIYSLVNTSSINLDITNSFEILPK